MQFYLLLHFYNTDTHKHTLATFNTKIKHTHFKKLKYKNIQNKKCDFKLSSFKMQPCERSGLLTHTQYHSSWTLWRLLEFALKENSWHTQAFFFIHCFPKDILVHHFFITCVHEELGQEFCKTCRSTTLDICFAVMRRTRELRHIFLM